MANLSCATPRGGATSPLLRTSAVSTHRQNISFKGKWVLKFPPGQIIIPTVQKLNRRLSDFVVGLKIFVVSVFVLQRKLNARVEGSS